MRTYKLWACLGVAVALSVSGFRSLEAFEILGVGTEFLLGNSEDGDLTDIDNDGDEFLYFAPDDLGGFDGIFFASDEATFGAGESAFNVFDNLLGPVDDKWCCGTVFPQIVGVDFDGVSYRLTHFTVSSANDTPDRDPRVWRIEGSNDAECWTPIFTQSDPSAALWTDRLQVILFEEGEDYDEQEVGYSMFRMITFATNLTSGAFFQIGEIEFFGEEADPGDDECEDACNASVLDTGCEVVADGLQVTWEIPDDCDCVGPTTVLVGGEEIESLEPDVTSTLIPSASLPDGYYTVEIRNCSGLGGFCTPFKSDNNGNIITQSWLVLGPISTPFVCDDASTVVGNQIAPSFIGCEYPTLGDEPREGVDFEDPENFAFEFHPDVEPIWRQFADGSPTNSDLDMDLDVGDVSLHMTWVATWVEYLGPGATTIQLCIGSDDGVQVWMNDQLLHTNPVCRGRAACQDTIVVPDVEPGVYVIRMGIWENAGGFGGSLALQDELGAPIVDGASDQWVFHGTERPADFVVPDCGQECLPVSNLVCTRDEDGTIDLEWENAEGCDAEIQLIANGEVIAVLEPGTDTHTLSPAEAPFALSVTVDNSSFATASCSLVEVLGLGTEALLGSVDFEGDLTDLDNDGDEFLYTGPDELGGFDAIFFASDEANFGTAEAAFNVFDNILGGGDEKWCCGTTFPQIVGADFDGVQYRLTHFTVSSANDTPTRDPRVWRIEGSNDGEEWTTIFAQDDPTSALWTDRLQVLLFREGRDYPMQTEAYSMFRMVTDATGLVGGAFFQISEIEFFGEEGSLQTGGLQLPGDVDQSGALDVTDSIVLLGHLFLGSPTSLGCAVGSDNNGDGLTDTSDAIALLVQLFAGGPPPVLGTSCVAIDGCPDACQ